MKILIFLLSLWIALPAYSHKCDCPDDQKLTEELPSKNESWYNYWGVGLATAKYSFTTQAIINAANDEYVLKGISWTADIFGFYFPLGQNAMLGGILNSRGGLSEENNGITTKVSSWTFGPSFMYFFGRNIGDGWFVRGDIGVTWAKFKVEDIVNTAVDDDQEGFGLLGGAGYALPVSKETRLLFNIYLTYRNVKDMSAVSTIFSFGVLL
jgi:hypothetical protein